jgi:hypothetical protein
MFSFLTDVDVMRLHKLLDAIIVVLMISSFFVVDAAAEETAESIVDARFDIELETATDLQISVTLDVSEITVFDHTYYSSDIQNAATNDLESMGAIKLRLRQLLEEQLESSFEDAVITALNEKPTYENTVFYDEFGVNLTSAFFSMNETVNTYDFINGVLDMGAKVFYEFTFQAELGWDNIYTVTLPTSMFPPYTNGKKDGDRIQWEVKNEYGFQYSTTAELSVKLKDPTTPALETDDIRLAFALDASDTRQISLTTNILAKHINIRNYEMLPESITDLDVISADGMRLFIDNEFTSWAEFYQKTLANITRDAVLVIENSSFNQTLDAAFRWNDETTANCSNPYNITHMDDRPAIHAELIDDDVDLQICGISSRALFGLIHTGATANISANDVNFGDNLGQIGYLHNSTIHLPDNLYLDGENSYTWNQSEALSGGFASDVATDYNDEQIETLIEIEVSSTDLNLLSFFTGKTELTLGLFIQEEKNYSVTSLPYPFTLPEKVLLDYLNSDAIRLCIEEGVFSEEEAGTFLTNEKQLFENKMITILPGLEIDGHVNRNAFDDSLIWDGNIGEMDADDPVQVVSYAHSSCPLSFGLSFVPPGFEISNQSLSVRGLQNQHVTYRMIFPHGISSVEVDDSLDRAVVDKTDDGRYYMEISFNASESGLVDDVSCKLTPSALFIVGIFMPCIVSLIITIILIIVIYIIRKKRKRGKKMAVEEESFDDEYGYEDQDYYVPPPPSSK